MAKVLHALSTASSRTVVAVCFLMVALGLGGALSTRADSINIFAPMWLGAGFVALVLVVWWSRRRKRTHLHRAAMLLCAMFVLATLVLFAPLRAAPSPAENIGNLRLVSFNMYKSNPDPDKVVRWLLSERADIVILLEAGPSFAESLEKMRHQFPYSYSCSRSDRCSTRIFARFPATEYWPLAEGDANNRRALSALTLRFRVHGTDIPVTAVHLPHPWPLGPQKAMIGDLADSVATLGLRGIIAGDFNSAPWTFAMRRLAAAGETSLASGGIPTWPAREAPMAVLPLDQIYLGPCLTARSVRKGPAMGSDHFPLVADIAISRCHG